MLATVGGMGGKFRDGGRHARVLEVEELITCIMDWYRLYLRNARDITRCKVLPTISAKCVRDRDGSDSQVLGYQCLSYWEALPILLPLHWLCYILAIAEVSYASKFYSTLYLTIFTNS